MRDVVLVRARKGLRIRRRPGANYAAVFEVPTAIGTLASKRGWGGADLSLGRPARPLVYDAPRVVHGRAPAAAGDGNLLGGDGPVRGLRSA